MRAFLAGIASAGLALGVAVPAAGQAQGPGFCDIISTAFGDEGKQQWIAQGGEQLDQAVKPLTDTLCTVGDEIVKGFEGGGAPPEMTQPARDFLTQAGCTFAAPPPDTTTTTGADGGSTGTTGTTFSSFDATSTTGGASVLGAETARGDELPATGAGTLLTAAGLAVLSGAVLARQLLRTRST